MAGFAARRAARSGGCIRAMSAAARTSTAATISVGVFTVLRYRDTALAGKRGSGEGDGFGVEVWAESTVTANSRAERHRPAARIVPRLRVEVGTHGRPKEVRAPGMQLHGAGRRKILQRGVSRRRRDAGAGM